MNKYSFKPCPFCGSSLIRLLPQELGFSVNCEICNAGIRAYGPKKAAYLNWNMRHEPSELSETHKELKDFIDGQNRKIKKS